MFQLLDEPRPTPLGRESGRFTQAKMKVISAAEKMLGEQSLAGAPLYKIAEASGQSNRYAVQYHFGDREGLVDAVFAARADLIAERRASLFELARDRGLERDLSTLLQCIYLPMAEQVDDQGRHSYIRFVLQYFVRPDADPAVDSRSSPSGGPAELIYRQLCVTTGLEFPEIAARIYYLGFTVHAALLAGDVNASDPAGSIAAVLSRLIPLVAATFDRSETSVLMSPGGFTGGAKGVA